MFVDLSLKKSNKQKNTRRMSPNMTNVTNGPQRREIEDTGPTAFVLTVWIINVHNLNCELMETIRFQYHTC